MKTYLLAAVAVFALSPAAHAADFIPDAGYDWTGLYAGLNAGYAWTDTSGTDIDGWTVIDGETINADGGAFVGGAQLGYNWQFNSLLAGVETDINYVGGSDTGTTVSAPFDNHVESDGGILGTLRLRAGFAADRFLVYGTGGLAFGDIGTHWYDDGGTFGLDTGSNMRVGWAAGAGVEYAVTDSASVKLEYLHFDLGSETENATNFRFGGGPPANYCGTPTCSFRLKTAGDLLRIGVNFQF
ncbi:MAG: porin family protein [Rhizobiales bacterium]|nr:porin family protein [Hyphomicrobiales bacterium]